MGRIWNNVKEVAHWAKRPLAYGLGHPVVNRALEHMGRVGKIVAGVSHLANLHYWLKGDKVAWRDGDWIGNSHPPVQEHHESVPLSNRWKQDWQS